MAFGTQQIDELIARFPQWLYDPVVNKMLTGFEFSNFLQAISFINAIGAEAQRLGHYPDILLYNGTRVQVTTSTFAENGITQRDVDLIAAIEAVFAPLQPAQADPNVPVREASELPVQPVQAVQPPTTPIAQPEPVQIAQAPQVPIAQPEPVSQDLPPLPAQPVPLNPSPISPAASAVLPPDEPTKLAV